MSESTTTEERPEEERPEETPQSEPTPEEQPAPEQPAPEERPDNEVQAEAAMNLGMTTARRLIKARKHEEAMDALLHAVRESQMWLDKTHPPVQKSA